MGKQLVTKDCLGEGKKVIKQEARPGTGEKGEGNHDSGRIKHIFVVSDFWDKGVPAFLSKVRNINLTCKGSCRQWKSSSMAGDLQMYIHTHIYGQSCKASPHTSAPRCQCRLWLSLTPGVQGAQCGPHAPPMAARDMCDSRQSHIWDRSGAGLAVAVPMRGDSSPWQDQALPGHGVLPTLHVGRNCSSLVSKILHDTEE